MLKRRKGEITTLLTLGLVVIGTIITLGTSLFINNKKNVAPNPRAWVDQPGETPRPTVKPNPTVPKQPTKPPAKVCMDNQCEKGKLCYSQGQVSGGSVCCNGNWKSGTSCSTIPPTPVTTCPGTKYQYSNGKCWLLKGRTCTNQPTQCCDKEVASSNCNTPGGTPHCSAGSYTNITGCQNICGEGQCQACIVGSTTKYECINTTTAPACSKPRTYSSQSNCINEGCTTCTQCTFSGAIRYECGGGGPVQCLNTQFICGQGCCYQGDRCINNNCVSPSAIPKPIKTRTPTPKTTSTPATSPCNAPFSCIINTTNCGDNRGTPAQDAWCYQNKGMYASLCCKNTTSTPGPGTSTPTPKPGESAEPCSGSCVVSSQCKSGSGIAIPAGGWSNCLAENTCCSANGVIIAQGSTCTYGTGLWVGDECGYLIPMNCPDNDDKFICSE